jgi:tRNA modification GTPase
VRRAATPAAPASRTEAGTIVAPATGPAPGGIGILRLSGPRALVLGRSVARGLPRTVMPRRVYLARFSDRSGTVLDEGLFLYFKAPRSFTGEDVVELHAHGSPALLALLQAEVLAGGARLAAPGEFTRRAFMNGRLDLARADAVADLVGAASEAQVRAAAARATGQWSQRLMGLRATLVGLRAELEGELDFPVEAEETPRVGDRLSAASTEAKALWDEARRGSFLRRGARVVLFGPVNAGKSTLFNALVGDARALVDAEPGTTRDALEAAWSLDGLGVTLVDTAGLRDAPGRLEAMGIAQTRAALARADLGILVVPPGAVAVEVAAWSALAGGVQVLQVNSKADLKAAPAGLAVSAQTGVGLEDLKRVLAQHFWNGASAAAAGASDLQVDAARQVEESVRRACEAHASSTLEVVSGEIGVALEALAEMTGENATAAVLDVVFQRFCIGK